MTKTYTQIFIEKAIEGGWYSMGRTITYNEAIDPKNIERILLDPLAWQAVGKVEGWDKGNPRIFRKFWLKKSSIEMKGSHQTIPFWQHQMHRMIDALAEGKTHEEYLSSLFAPKA